jgi:hypothetical protein
MEALKRLEYEQELWGRLLLLDPSNPEALNFYKEQSFKSFGTAGTNASMFTAAHLVLLGGTAYEPQGESEVYSQESDIFDTSKVDSIDKENIEDYKGRIIENMGILGPCWTVTIVNKGLGRDTNDKMEEDEEEAVKVVDLVHSPAKVTLTASAQGFSTELSDAQCKGITKKIK